MTGVLRYIAVFCCAVLLFFPAAGNAQNAANPDSNKPLEITAQESLEWHRGELYFQAKKDVVASQGTTTLYCDDMVARYRDSKEKNIDIYRIEASGSVRIISADSKAYGDAAVYNIDEGYAEMMGSDLRLVSEDQNVTAKDMFLYYVADGRLEAIGDAVAVREGDKIKADKLIAVFAGGQEGGKRELKTLEAVGNVVITTPDETLSSDHAFYSAKTGLAELNDNVRIMRGESFVEGARGELDMNTNISKIFGAENSAGDSDASSGRVRAVFYPKDKDNAGQ